MEDWSYEQPDWDAEHEFCDEFEAARAQSAATQYDLSQGAWEATMQDHDKFNQPQALEQCEAAAAVPGQTLAKQQPVRSVVWASAPAVEAVSVPHCEKLKFGGEDGHFVCTTKQGQRLVLGVADGVSGSRSDEDPETLVADWVREVTSQLSQVLEECPELGMQEAVLQVLQGLPEAAPSTTLCFAFLEPGRRMRVLNLGDSRLAVFRHGQPVFITEPQQYPDCWNAPLQVRGGPLAAADLAGAVVSEVEVLPGDVIAVGTDGFWDNLFLNKAAELVMEAIADRRGDPKGIANYLGEAACDNRRSNDAIVPFHVAWALAEGKTLDHVRLGGKEDDLTLLVTVVPEVVVEEEDEEPTPCSSQSMEVEEEEVEGMVSTSANSMDDDVDFFDGFCFGEEEDDERCSLHDMDEWELPASTSSPARAAAFLWPCGPETHTTGKVNIITPISSSSGGGNSGACDQAVQEGPSSAHNVFDCSQTGGVEGQEGEGVGAYALVALGHAQAGTKVDAQTSSVFETAAAQGCALSRTSSLRSEALLGLSPQPSWAPEAPDAVTAPAVAAVAAAAALSVLAAAPAAGYSSEEEGEGSDCSTGSNFSGCGATAAATSSPTPTAAAAAADKPLEGHAAPWCGWDNAGSCSITSDEASATMDAGSSPLLVDGCSDGQDTASTNSAAAATTGVAGDGNSNSNSSTSGRSSSSLIQTWGFGPSRTSSSSNSSSNGSFTPHRHAWSVIDTRDIQVYGNSTYEHGSEACSVPAIHTTCRWPTQPAAGLDSSDNKGSSQPSSVIGSIITSSSSHSSGSAKDSIGPQDLEGPLRCSSDREASGVSPPPLCAQVGMATTSSPSSSQGSVPAAAPASSSSTSSSPQQQSGLRAKCLLCGTRVTPLGAPHVCEIEPVVTGNVELVQQQQQQTAAASAASAKPSGWGKRVQAAMQRLRCVDNSRAAAADAAASHLQQQERSRLAGAKGAGVRSAACLSVIDEGDSAGVTSSGSMVTAQVLPLQPAAANEATPLPGSKGFKLWRSSSSGSSSLSRGDSSTLSTLMGSLGEVMGAGMFARRSTTGGSPDVPAKATTVATTTTSTTSSSSHPMVTAGGVAGPALSSDSVLMKGAIYNTKVVGTDLAGDVGAVLVAAAAPDQLIQGGAAGGNAASSKRGSVKKFLSAWGCFGQPKVMH